jgi:2-(1,2-epoxy-1,2-dihydrophenyl)acetyl-CoA isomerase
VKLGVADIPLLLTQDGLVARIRFAAPESLNALTVAMALRMLEALRGVADNRDIRVLVLSGEGRAFMAGGDIRFVSEGGAELAPTRADLLITHLHEVIETMVAYPIPILSVVHGAVAGAGLSIMLASDFVLAASDTRFVFGYSNLGTSPDGGLTWFLERALGTRRTMQWAFLQKHLVAEEALRCGLVQQLSAADSLLADAATLAHKITLLPLHAFHRTKQLMRGSSTTTLSEQLAAEREAFVDCAGNSDFAEGLTAFLEGRSPRFKLPRIELDLPAVAPPSS